MEIATTQRHSDVENWLDVSCDDCQYERYTSLRLDGTCNWIFSHPAFESWGLEDFTNTGAKLLWIRGPAGFGKTILCARIVQHVKETLKLPVAHCFSWTYAQTANQLDDVIRSWIVQMARESEQILDLVQEVRHKHKARRASKYDIWTLLRDISLQSRACVFILDGLDEFRANDHSREIFLRDLKRAVAYTRTRIVITSRSEVDIESELCASVSRPPHYTTLECSISTKNVKDDVDLFSRSIVAKKLPDKDESFRQDLARQIAERCEGMFLWIKLQQDKLRGGKSKRKLRDIVQAMPQGLLRAYNRSWDNIQSLDDEDRQRAISILRWLVFAYRPLTVREMTEALIIDIDDRNETFCEDYLPETIDDNYVNGEIKGLCSSLIEVRSGSDDSSLDLRTVHLVHASVREFLICALPLPPTAKAFRNKPLSAAAHNFHLGISSVQFLNCPQAWNLDEQDAYHVFTDYATWSWFRHVSDSREYSNEAFGFINSFMKTRNPNFSKWAQLYESRSPERGDISIQNSNPITPLYYACLFGLLPSIDFLYRSEKLNINSVGGQYGTPLQAVCAKGHKSAFDRLLEWGADVNIKAGIFGNALIAAVYHDRLEMVEVLLEHGAHINAAAGHKPHTAVTMAASKGHTEMVRLLLGRGANINRAITLDEKPRSLSQSPFPSTPLHEAAETSQLEVASILLELGAEIDAHDDGYNTPLHLAVLYRNPEMLTFLLDRGANINLQGYYGTPLHVAASIGQVGLLTLLLQKGANINAGSWPGWTPLHGATSNGHIEIAILLLQQGADVNADVQGWTPLHFAAKKGFLELASILIQKGTNVNAKSKYDLTPLYLASENGHLEVVKLLIQQGAKVDAQAEGGWTPLHIAVDENHHEIARLLFRWGDTTIVPRSDLRLHYLIQSCDVDFFQQVIIHCIDIQSNTDTGNTPLRIAITTGPDDIIDLFIQYGANLSFVDCFGMTCLGWLRRLRPSHRVSLQKSNETVGIHLDPDMAILRHTIASVAARLKRTLAKSAHCFYTLGQCFLRLNLDVEAAIAYQQSLLLQDGHVDTRPVCDICDTSANMVDPWYVCKVCPEIDLCANCMDKQSEQGLRDVCRHHYFLRIIGIECRIQSGQTEVLDRWLDKIVKQYGDR